MASGLTAEQIQALLASGRTKGEYLVLLNKFINSGENGVHVQSEWPQLKGKKPATLKQGFEAATKNKEAADGSDKVVVRVSDDQVFLLNMAVVQAELEAEAA